MSKPRYFLTVTDVACLQFLWKWKMSTTAAIANLVFSTRSFERTYRRLLALNKLKMIQSTYSRSGNSHVWTLDDLGYEFIKESLPKLKICGFRSENMVHDYWVTAIHLGVWYSEIPENCGLITEQELRRIDFENYPEWVPKTLNHRPDGWWKIGRSPIQRLVSLEVELSLKTPNAYREVAQFYGSKNQVSDILWFVKSRQAAAYILNHMGLSLNHSQSKHSLFLLDHYWKQQGFAKVQWGRNVGKSLNEIVTTVGTPSATQSSALGLLDTRKKPVKSDSFKGAAFFDGPLSREYAWSAGVKNL